MSRPPLNLTAVRRRYGWTWYCHDCQRGHMTAGPMTLHLKAKVHGLSLTQIGRVMYEAKRTAEGAQP